MEKLQILTNTLTFAEETKNESMLNCVRKDLYQNLLDPVRQYVVGSQAIVVPEGPLALVPFAALMDENGHYVAETLQLSLVPSLTTAKMIRERSEDPAGGWWRPLVIGDPDVGKIIQQDKIVSVPRLPCAMIEVETVGKVLGVKPLVGETATKNRFLQKVESANMIHIAAHGDARRGEILLARPPGTDINKLEDVMLKLSDLERKRLKAKLVVLSSCYSGVGDVRGEGVVGIARAFLGAGARAVLVTLWAIDDRATLLFMAHFYYQLWRGGSASASLNKAMNAVREHVDPALQQPNTTAEAVKQDKMFSHPRYWAPFALIGEDVTPFPKP